VLVLRFFLFVDRVAELIGKLANILLRTLSFVWIGTEDISCPLNYHNMKNVGRQQFGLNYCFVDSLVQFSLVGVLFINDLLFLNIFFLILIVFVLNIYNLDTD